MELLGYSNLENTWNEKVWKIILPIPPGINLSFQVLSNAIPQPFSRTLPWKNGFSMWNFYPCITSVNNFSKCIQIVNNVYRCLPVN
jgi:hypothetical protein